jgi:hypothetical protein
VASKKKAEKETEKKQLGKGGKGKKPASTKTKPKKAAAKKVAPQGANAAKANCKPAKQGRIRVPDVVEQGETVETTVRELDPFEVAKQTVKGSVPAIVEAMVELAKQGSCSHAKTLLEMTGARYMFDGETATQDNGEPWAKLVLERLSEVEPLRDGKEVPV